jgi:hypothetical protein
VFCTDLKQAAIISPMQQQLTRFYNGKVEFLLSGIK